MKNLKYFLIFFLLILSINNVFGMQPNNIINYNFSDDLNNWSITNQLSGYSENVSISNQSYLHQHGDTVFSGDYDRFTYIEQNIISGGYLCVGYFSMSISDSGGITDMYSDVLINDTEIIYFPKSSYIQYNTCGYSQTGNVNLKLKTFNENAVYFTNIDTYWTNITAFFYPAIPAVSYNITNLINDEQVNFSWINNTQYFNLNTDYYSIYVDDIFLENTTNTSLTLYGNYNNPNNINLKIWGFNTTENLTSLFSSSTDILFNCLIPTITNITNITYFNYLSEINNYGDTNLLLDLGINDNNIVFISPYISTEIKLFLYCNSGNCTGNSYTVWEGEEFNISTVSGLNYSPSYSNVLTTGDFVNGWNEITISNPTEYMIIESGISNTEMLSFDSSFGENKPYISYNIIPDICEISPTPTPTPAPTPAPNHRFNGGSDFGVYLFLIVILIISIYMGKL